MRTIHFTLLIAFTLMSSTALWAQPSNDGCEAPIPITDVTSWCSAGSAFTSVAATPSGYGPASCFSNAGNDVWFSFVAEAEDVTIVIRGATNIAPGGTMVQPEVAIYAGTCGGTINELQCETDIVTANIVEMYKGGLTIGETYLIRVQGRNNQTGTFQLCINNYNLPDDPQNDCITASVLCDKSPFTVQQVVGNGSDPDEAEGTCLSIVPPSETNSAWFTWTCATAGTLTFILTPTNETDDLDFVVYELPNGIHLCDNKNDLRCMASGDFNYPSICMGPTGLADFAGDISEPAGCAQAVPQDNFVSPINMMAGKTYALLVNNFTSTGNGFSIEFGGTGTFLGPTADFTSVPADSMCIGGDVTFTDASFYPNGSIVDWQWNFGTGASPQTASGQGPHTVSYNSTGTKSISLTVESDKGCEITIVKTIVIIPLLITPDIVMPTCNGGQDGAISLTVTGGENPYLYNWGSGFQANGTLSNLSVGTYNVSVQDANGCYGGASIDVNELEILLDPGTEAITPPSCFGDSDGSITVVVANGLPPYTYNWGNGPGPGNTLNNIGSGTYTVTVQDANLCDGFFTFEVVDPPPLELSIDTINISCYGANDGQAIAQPSGGVGGYTYVWSDGQVTSIAQGLVEGNYSVTVTDANGCVITGGVFILEPPQVFVDVVNIENILCFGDSTGTISVSGSGGTPGYEYSIDGFIFQSDTVFANLLAGTYIITVQDARGCVAFDTATIVQPEQLIVQAGADVTINLGFDTQLEAIIINPPNRPADFLWSPDASLSPSADIYNPTAMPLATTTYTVTATDETGCTATDALTVTVIKYRPIYIPNVFSPNADGINDFFTAYGNVAASEIALFRVFDRWGSLIFETQNIALGIEQLGWDGRYRGKELLPDVFAFYMEIIFIDGEKILYKGDIQIVK